MSEQQTQVDEAKQTDGSKIAQTLQVIPQTNSMWLVILAMYLLLLLGVGYVAFWEQDFNRSDKVVASYISIIAEYKANNNGENSLTDEELTGLIRELIQQQASSSGDLQELASQSFNIILGAVLAFLSASATMIFRRSDEHKK